MKHWLFILLAAGLMGGCAAAPAAGPQAAVSSPRVMPARHTAVAAALALDPLGADHQPLPEIWLSRDDRGVSAYGGYPSVSAEYYDVQTDDDLQYYNYPSTYERRVLSDRVGVIYR